MQNTDPSAPTGPEGPDEFPDVLAAVQRRFAAHAGGPLFFTRAEGLWPIFLANIPAQLQQNYTCNSCRHFVERFGSLVAIDESGRASSALWADVAPAGFELAFRRMAEAATQAEIAGVLVPATPMLGTPFSPPTATGKVWTHFAVGVPQAHAHPLLSASQVQAERREDHHMLARGLAEFPQELVERAHALLTSGTLYRSEKCIGVAAWLLALHQQLAGVKSARQKDALIWKAAALPPSTAPTSGAIPTKQRPPGSTPPSFGRSIRSPGCRTPTASLRVRSSSRSTPSTGSPTRFCKPRSRSSRALLRPF